MKNGYSLSLQIIAVYDIVVFQIFLKGFGFLENSVSVMFLMYVIILIFDEFCSESNHQSHLIHNMGYFSRN